MRTIIFGTTGSGKSTFAGKLAAAQGVDFIELDLINWRPNWYDRARQEPDAFVKDVRDRISQDDWVATGSYSLVRPMMWSRATHLVYLDLPRALVMAQVIKRSFQNALSQRDVFPGCRESFKSMLSPEHPIRWAWDTYERRRETFRKLTRQPEYQHLQIVHCKSRKDVAAALTELARVRETA